MRRPNSSLSLRSPTPTLFSKRPGTPSLHFNNFNATHSTPTLQTIPSLSTSASSSSLQQPTYSGYIKVSVRVKPPNTNKSSSATKVEVSSDGSTSVINDQWTIDTNRNSIAAKEVGEFVFDNIYHGSIPNSQIFDNSVRELVDQVMAGYNGTVFAYGMTGSGKTYSMQGDSSNPGIIPLSARAIFDYANSPPNPEEDRSYTIKVAYLEIYNEHLNDLLSPSTSSEDIKLRDDPTRGVRALGLKEVAVDSPEKLLEYIQAGDALRRTEGTEFNSKSSRSHAVVQISIESTSSSQPGVRTSTLYLCDLAGSERAASQTERRKEGAYINKSLLTLGTVIARLCAASTGSGASAGHIPYRDSKLTRLLQPALSGKSLVSVLCTIDVNTGAGIGGASGTGTGNIISSSSTNTTYVETISTLRFAARAKNIIVSVKRNEETGDSSRIIEKLMFQLEAQKIEIAKLKAASSAAAKLQSMAGSGDLLLQSGSDNSAQYLSQIAQLEAENKILHERVEHLTRLCDDTKLEEMIFGSDNSDGNNGMYDMDPPSSATSINFSNLEEDHPVRKQISEYKSYISHLEKQLYLAEVQKSAVGGPQPLFLTQNDSNINMALGNNQSGSSVMSLPNALPQNSFPSSTSRYNNDQNFYYNELIQDLREEIEELQESNADKDRIITALRSINRRKENLNALSINRNFDSGNGNVNRDNNSGTPSNTGNTYLGNISLNASSSEFVSSLPGSGINTNSTCSSPVVSRVSSASAAAVIRSRTNTANSISTTIPSFEARPVSNGSSPVRTFSLQETTVSPIQNQYISPERSVNGKNPNNPVSIVNDNNMNNFCSLPPPPSFLPSSASNIPNALNSNHDRILDLKRQNEGINPYTIDNRYPNLNNITTDLETFEESFVNNDAFKLDSPTGVIPDSSFSSMLNVNNNARDNFLSSNTLGSSTENGNTDNVNYQQTEENTPNSNPVRNSYDSSKEGKDGFVENKGSRVLSNIPVS